MNAHRTNCERAINISMRRSVPYAMICGASVMGDALVCVTLEIRDGEIDDHAVALRTDGPLDLQI